MPGSPAPLICSGWAGPRTGQNAQAALNQALSQAWNGAVRYTRLVSAFHLAQFRGQFTSAALDRVVDGELVLALHPLLLVLADELAG